MRTVIITGVAAVVGFAYYCEPDEVKSVTIVRTVDVPYEVEVVKYVTVPIITTNHIEVVTYVDRPILVKPNIRYEDQSDREQDMIEGVKFFEGYKRNRYVCAGGVATIGYGCTDKKIVSRGTISKPVATKLLLSELDRVKIMVDEAVEVELNDNQLNALTSFAFNCGMTNLKQLINGANRLNDGNYESVAKYLPQYRLAAGKPRLGLERRRAWELSLWQGAPVLP